MVLPFVLVLCLSTPDAATIFADSVRADRENLARMVNYVFQEDVRYRYVDKAGAVQPTEHQGFEVTILEGAYYYKQVRQDEQPLSQGALREEQKRLEKEAEERRKRRAAGQPVARSLRDRFVLQYSKISRFADFVLLGDEEVEGRSAWVLQAVPKSGTDPQTDEEEFLADAVLTLWIDKETSHRVRLQANVRGEVPYFEPGTVIRFDYQQIDGGWLRNRVLIRRPITGLLAKLVKAVLLETEQTYREFRKFQAESTIRLSMPGDDDPNP